MRNEDVTKYYFSLLNDKKADYENYIENIRLEALDLLIEKVTEIGVSESARRCQLNKSHVSRIIGKKKYISFDKIKEYMNKIIF